VQVIEDIVLDYRVLSLCCILSSRQVAADAVTECKDVLVLFVLQGVFVNIHKSEIVSETRVDDELLRLAGRVDASSEEGLLNDLA
jgi:hypothetical protein